MANHAASPPSLYHQKNHFNSQQKLGYGIVNGNEVSPHFNIAIASLLFAIYNTVVY